MLMALNVYNHFITVTSQSQITGIWTVCTVVCSGAHQRKHQGYALLALVRRIQLWRGFSSQRASNAENVSNWWRHHIGQWRPNEMVSILQTFSKQLISNFEFQISKILHFVFRICSYPICYQLPLVQIMAWRRTGDKSLSAKNEDLVHWRIYPSPSLKIKFKFLYKLQVKSFPCFKMFFQLNREITMSKDCRQVPSKNGTCSYKSLCFFVPGVAVYWVWHGWAEFRYRVHFYLYVSGVTRPYMGLPYSSGVRGQS